MKSTRRLSAVTTHNKTIRMKKIFLFTAALAALLTGCQRVSEPDTPTLKSVLGQYFLVGVAMNTDQVSGADSLAQQVVLQNFNSVVAENCMKQEVLAPEPGKYDFTEADRLVKWGNDNGLKVVGHTLVWHSQPAPWFFTDDKGQSLTREALLDRMHQYISTVMGRYKGKIYGWDVVNEAFEDDGSLRQTPYLRIIGPDYIEKAFQFAHEADPDAQLYYNDYSMAKPGKRKAVCQLVDSLKAKGLRIDAVGMQSHNGVDYPELAEYEATMDSLFAHGVKINISELDLNLLPNPDNFGGAEVSQDFAYQEKMNPYRNGLDSIGQKNFDDRYMAFFDIYRRHKAQIERVTPWGVADHNSWLNDWPIKGRTSYPLLFDRNYQPKPVVGSILRLFEQEK